MEVVRWQLVCTQDSQSFTMQLLMLVFLCREFLQRDVDEYGFEPATNVENDRSGIGLKWQGDCRHMLDIGVVALNLGISESVYYYCSGISYITIAGLTYVSNSELY